MRPATAIVAVGDKPLTQSQYSNGNSKQGDMMTSDIRYTSERNGYRVEVVEYTVNRKHGYAARVTNLTTRNSLQEPGFATYGTALAVAQQIADDGKF